ncbi:hypothetical protein P692DRAFT_20678251, partial [Suillus brevipes Sb2]
KVSGLSKAPIKHGYRGLARRSKVLPASQQGQRIEEARTKRMQDISDMSSADREAVEKMIIDVGMDTYTEHCAAPPGEEGFDISHEGGEYEAFEGLSEQVASLSHVCYVDARTRHDRIELQTEQWHNQIDRLVDSYLDYR